MRAMPASRHAGPHCTALVTLVALGWVSATRASAQDPGVQRQVRVEAESLDGSRRLIELPAAPAASISELDAVALSFESSPATRSVDDADRAVLSLRGGDRLSARIRGGRGDRLDVEWGAGETLAFDVDAIEAIRFPMRTPRAWRGSLDAPEKGDRLYWIRGQAVERVDGTLAAFEADGIRFEGVLGTRLFPWAEVAALLVEALPRPARPGDSTTPASRVAIDLADGGRLHGELLELSASGASLEIEGGKRLTLPVATLREITVDDGSYVFVSDLEPALAREGWPPDDGFGMRWPWQRDRAVTGDSLRAGGREWPRGIGVHAPSRLEYALDGGFAELRGHVALDDSTRLLAYRGSVEFAIYVDGASEPAWRSGRVRGGDAPLAIPPVALAGARRLALQVDMDERSYVADRADWLRLVLVRR
jgi:hypothetical protein